MRLSSAPLLPAFLEAAVGYPAERQIGHVPPQVSRQFAGVGVTRLSVLGEAFVQQVVEGSTYTRIRGVQDSSRLFFVGRRTLPGERLKQQDAQRIDIGTRIQSNRDGAPVRTA